MLTAGHPIFFGCDVGKFSSSASGIMDPALIDYELGFNIRLGMSKAQRLMTGESAMTHAMVLTAVHVEDGKSVRWRVQNSWGESAGDKGWFVMSDAWLDEFGKFWSYLSLSFLFSSLLLCFMYYPLTHSRLKLSSFSCFHPFC